MTHSKMPPVPPASRSPNDSPEAPPPHAPQEETAKARAAGPADKDNIRQNITNKGMQQNR